MAQWPTHTFMKATENLYQEHKLIEFRVKFEWHYKIFEEKQNQNYFKCTQRVNQHRQKTRAFQQRLKTQTKFYFVVEIKVNLNIKIKYEKQFNEKNFFCDL